MAKKQAKPSTDEPAPSSSPQRAPKAGPDKAARAKRSAPKAKPATAAPGAQKRVFSEVEIGIVAGEVWKTLSERDGQTVTALKKSVDAPSDLAMAALGWLAREGKLEFETSGRSVKVSLR